MTGARVRRPTSWTEAALTERFADRKSRRRPDRLAAYPERGAAAAANLCEVDNKYLSLYRGLIPVPPMKRRTWRDVAAEVAAEHGITVGDLVVGRSRARRISWPRQDLMWRLYVTGKLSAPRIGHLLGGYDHSTVMHGVRRHQARIDAGKVMP